MLAGRAVVRVWATVWLALMLAPAVVAGRDLDDRGIPVGDDGVITRANLGPTEPWPLRIDRGKFVCIDDAVFISDGGTAYPLNGPARALTRSDPSARRPLEDIWLTDDKTLAAARADGIKVKMIRVDIGPVLKRGVNWCRSRRSH